MMYKGILLPMFCLNNVVSQFTTKYHIYMNRSIPSPMPTYSLAGGAFSVSTGNQSQAIPNHSSNQAKSTSEYGNTTGATTCSGISCSKDLVTVNKMNFVASSVLAKDSARKIDFDFTTHTTFPVLKFV